MQFNTDIILDYEDQALITQETLRTDILFHLQEETLYGDGDSDKYNLVDCLLDAFYFYSTEEEYAEFTEEIGADFVKLRNKVVK